MSLQDLLAAAGSDSDIDESAKDLARKCGYGVAALTITPIPLTEIAILSVHVGMVIGIGQLYGQTMTRGPAAQFLLRIGATVGLSYVGTELAITAARLLPFVGSLLAGVAGASFRYASTICLGAVARIYFKNQGEISDDEIKSVFKEQFETAKKSFSMTEAKSSSAKELAQAAVKDAKEDKDDAQPTPDVSPTIAPEYAKQAAAPAAPPAAEDEDKDKDKDNPVVRLERLKSLLDKGLIDQGEYDTVKQRILDTI